MIEKASGRLTTDREAHERAMSAPIGEVVRQLCDILGATDVAAIGGVSETRAVAQWMNGRGPHHTHKLRFALQIATMIATAAEHGVVRAWFHGSNPFVKDQSPLSLLRDNPLEVVQQDLLAAARSFAERPR